MSARHRLIASFKVGLGAIGLLAALSILWTPPA